MTLVHKNPGDPGHTTDHNEIVDKVNAIPPGGAPGQVLGKDSPTDYDTSWQTVTGGGGGVTSVNARTGAVTGLAEASALTAHEADTTNIHGITNTAVLVTQTDLTTHAADTTAVHGIADTSALVTQTDLTTHATDTTAVHGIADTAVLVTQTDLNTHAADTTAVHGIADTSALATLAYVDAHMTDVLDAHDASAISVVPQGQQVGTDVQAAINNLDTRIAASLESGPDFLRTQALFYDDFLGTATIVSAATGQIGALGWIGAPVNGGQVAVAATGIADVPGFVGLQSGTTAANGLAVIVLNSVDFCGHPIFVMEWRAMLSAVNNVGVDDYTVRFGLGDAGVALPPVDGYYFEYTPADTSWHYRTAKGSTRDDKDSNLVADTGWHRFRMVSDGGGAITATIDGANTQVLNTSAAIPTTADFFGPIAGLAKSTGTAQKQLRIDYFYLLWGCNRP